MTSNAQRIVTGCIAVPVLFALILFLPQLNHLAFCIVVFLACAEYITGVVLRVDGGIAM